MNSQFGYIVGDGCTQLETLDGGETFAQARCYDCLGHEDWLSVDFSDDGEGSMVGVMGAIANFFPPGSAMAVSNNASWGTKVTESSETLHSVKAASKALRWAVGDDAILNFNDATQAWERNETIQTHQWHAIHYVDTNSGHTLWTVGSNGRLAKRTDSGTTWERIMTVVTVTLNTVFFINQSIGWMAGEGGAIYKTTTGGESP